MFSFKTPDGKINLREALPPIIGIAAIIFLFLWPAYNPTVVILGVRIITFVILAVAWAKFSGPTGYMSLGTAAFFGIGIYYAALVGGNLPLPVLMLTGAAVSFVIAALLGVVTLRLKGVYFTIFTFGLTELLRNFVMWYELEMFGVRGRSVPTEPQLTVYYYLIGLMVILLVFCYIVRRSSFGKALVGIGQSEESAAHIGINTTFVKVIMLAITSAFMGAAGAATATRRMYVDAETAFEMNYAFLPVIMVIFGGTRNLAGPVIGAIIFGYIQTFLITRFALFYMIAMGFVMVLSILFMPDGIVGLIYKTSEKVRARANIEWTDWKWSFLNLPGKLWMTLIGTVVFAVFSILTWVKLFEVVNINLWNFWSELTYYRWLFDEHMGISAVRITIMAFSILLVISLALLVVSMVLHKSSKRTMFAYTGFGIAVFITAFFILMMTGIPAVELTIFPTLAFVAALCSLVFFVKLPIVGAGPERLRDTLPVAVNGGAGNADS